MPLESPASVLYDDYGVALAVTSSAQIPVSQSALLIAGVQDTGLTRFIRASADGSVFITGSISAVASGIQDVNIVSTAVTQSITGSVFAFNNSSLPLFITASGTGITVTNSAANPLFITSSTALTISGAVNQGSPGTAAQGWFVRLTDGVNTLGGSNLNPLIVEEVSSSAASVTSVPRSATSVVIVSASNTANGVYITNDSNTNLFLRFGTTAATTVLYTVKLTSNAFFEVPSSYIGQITGIWSNAGAGSALVTVVSASS